MEECVIVEANISAAKSVLEDASDTKISPPSPSKHIAIKSRKENFPARAFKTESIPTVSDSLWNVTQSLPNAIVTGTKRSRVAATPTSKVLGPEDEQSPSIRKFSRGEVFNSKDSDENDELNPSPSIRKFSRAGKAGERRALGEMEPPGF